VISGAGFPIAIDLPAGFAPEGIAIAGSYAYLGSRVTGSVYRADLATGAGEIIYTGSGTPTHGLRIDGRGRAFLSGGDVRVIDIHTGELLAAYPIGLSFINDVVLTRDAAWFTDSFSATLHRLPFTGNGSVGAVPLTGITITAGTVNLNGICVAPDGRALLVVQANTGLLFRVDPATGAAARVSLGGASVVNGDGLLLDGHTLYVVRNRANVVDVFTLNRGGTAGVRTGTIADPGFAIPTAAASHGGRLYVVNSRLTTPLAADVRYNVIAVPRPA
jgi:sugar lactone lactonase YvrE